MLLDRGETFMIMATKIMLPRVDIFTDLKIIIRGLCAEGYCQLAMLHAVGYAMICVFVLSWIMTIPHFLRVENHGNSALRACPLDQE